MLHEQNPRCAFDFCQASDLGSVCHDSKGKICHYTKEEKPDILITCHRTANNCNRYFPHHDAGGKSPLYYPMETVYDIRLLSVS